MANIHNLMREYERAVEDFKQAEQNFNMAQFEYLDVAIMYLNFAEQRIDAITREIMKLKNEKTIPGGKVSKFQKYMASVSDYITTRHSVSRRAEP